MNYFNLMTLYELLPLEKLDSETLLLGPIRFLESISQLIIIYYVSKHSGEHPELTI